MQYIIFALLLVLLGLAYFRVADRFNIIDKPNMRSSHTSVSLRGGGIIFLFGAWLYAAFFGFDYGWFLLGLTLSAWLGSLTTLIRFHTPQDLRCNLRPCS